MTKIMLIAILAVVAISVFMNIILFIKYRKNVRNLDFICKEIDEINSVLDYLENDMK